MDFNYVQPNSVTSASAAARLGDLERLRGFVTSAGPEDRAWLAVDNRGWGPLHHAASNGHEDCVKFLGELEMVDINARTWEGETALFLAAKNLPVTAQAVHALLKLNANVNIATNEACSALQYAAVKTDPTVTRSVNTALWLVIMLSSD